MLLRLLLGFGGSSIGAMLAALCGLLFVVEGGAGMAGGSAPGGAPAGDGGQSGGDAGGEIDIEVLREEPQADASAEVGASDGDDDDGDDHDIADDQLPYKDDPIWKKTKNRLRNLQRKVSKTKELRAAIESTGLDHSEVIRRARMAERFEDLLRSNPKLREALGMETSGRSSDDRADGQSRAGTASAKEFDASKFPFDPTAPGSDYLLEQAKTVHGLAQRAEAFEQRLEQRFGAVEKLVRSVIGHIQGGEQRQVEATWKTEAESASKHLPPRIRVGGREINLRAMFLDNVGGALQVARARGIRVDGAFVKQVIGHYLKEAKQNAPGAAANAQRIAERNTHLPRAAAMSGGQPAGARAKRETVAEVNARLRRSFGGS
jgi:hypothetical protein